MNRNTKTESPTRPGQPTAWAPKDCAHKSPEHKTIAIIQARLGSTRLPGKILLDIAGQSMLERVVSRVQQAALVDQVVIATTDAESDQPLVEYCEDRDWSYYRGSENDVLSRYAEAAEQFGATRVVRITSDCPLIDPELIDQLIQIASRSYCNSNLDYCCNFFPTRRYPRGLDCEVVSTVALNRIDRLADKPEYREHVTLYAYRNTAEFSMGSLTCSADHSNLRWTVDTSEDLELVRMVYQHFESLGDSSFNWKQVIAAYQSNPAWHNINQLVLQKAA